MGLPKKLNILNMIIIKISIRHTFHQRDVQSRTFYSVKWVNIGKETKISIYIKFINKQDTSILYLPNIC